MAIKGILFDKDGTLLDFFGTWIPAYKAAAEIAAEIAGDRALAYQMLRATGFDPAHNSLDPLSLLAGGTTAQICEAWADEAGIIDRAGFTHRIHEAMDAHASTYPVPVADGLDRMFERLAGKGYSLGIATMDSEFVARVTADSLGLSKWLTFLAGYDSGHGAKPEPGMVYGFCEASGLVPAEILVIGDTDRDAGMARSAGAAIIVGVLTGATSQDQLAPITDHVLDSVFDLEAYLSNR